MPKTPAEPAHLFLEHFRVLRETIAALADKIDALSHQVTAENKALKTDIRGLQRNMIAEIYKANLTVASFVDHEERIRALESKSP